MKVRKLFNRYPKGSFGWWFNNIPEKDVKEKAFSNFKLQTHHLNLGDNAYSASLGSAIDKAFTWDKTPEGHTYWSEIKHKYDTYYETNFD